MRTLKDTSGMTLLGLFKSNPGTPVSKVRVYLETEPVKERIAYQQTGDAGSVTFAHLDKGVYKIYLEIPVQKENRVKNDQSAVANFQVGYHGKRKTLFFQNPSGNFMINFSDIEKLAESNITPMHETESAEFTARIAIAKLEVTGKYGSLTLKISALSELKFQKQIKKYEHEPGMAIISNG